METEIQCKSCHAVMVVIENKLFFSEEKKMTVLVCPSCKDKIGEELTDGWFFIQTKEQYIYQLRIERQKEVLKFEGAI